MAAAITTGCQTLPNTATDTLSEPQGNGALAIATAISKFDASYPCETFSFDLHETVDGELVDAKPQTLRLFVYEDTDYALFDGIKPGNYVMTQTRCNIKRGFVVDGKSYLAVDLDTEHVIKPNTVTISSRFIYATQEKDSSFNVQVATFEPKLAAEFQDFLKKEISDKWAMGYF